MNIKNYFLPILIGCAALFVGSFTDEGAQIIFALHLETPASISALFSAALGGGIFASTMAPRILLRLGPSRTIAIAFILQAMVIVLASLLDDVFGYLIGAGALGCTGSIFWSAVMVAAPGVARSESDIERMNQGIQTTRNLGYVAGPLLGTTLYTVTSGQLSLLLLAFTVLVAATISFICLRSLNLTQSTLHSPEPENLRKNIDIKGLLNTNGVVRAIFPLVVTIVVTSALNVLLLVRIRHDMNFNAQIYGLVVSALSCGLVLAPLTIARVFSRLGDAAGAAAAAGLIGAGICWLAMGNEIWSIAFAAFIIGSANGVQNTLMANFIMKRIDKGCRVNQMPAYMLIVQVSVLIGFIGVSFMQDIRRAESYLLIIGAIALAVGACGFFINVGERKNLQAGEF